MAISSIGTMALSALLLVQQAAGPVTSDRRAFFKPHTPDQTEMLQRATSLAIGNLAWESVTVSEVQKTKTGFKWTAKTRSNTYFCIADPQGQDPSCERP